MPHDSPLTLVFWHQSSRWNSNGITPWGWQLQVRWVKIRHFLRKTCYNSKTVKDRRIVFIKVEYEVIYDLSNGDVSDDIEWHLTPKPPQFWIFRRFSPSWIFKFVKFPWQTVSWRPRLIIVLNVVKIRHLVVETLQFFEFSKWRPSAILDLFEAYLDHPQRVIGGLYHSAKFGYDWCSSFYNMNILTFGTFGRKMPIHAPKIVVLGHFDPLDGLKYQPKLKRHTLAWVHLIWAIKRENVVNGLTRRWVA